MAEKNSDAIRGISNCIMKMMEFLSGEYEMGGLERPAQSIGKKTRVKLWENGGDEDEGPRWGIYNANMRSRIHTGGDDGEYSSSSDGEDKKADGLFIERVDCLAAEREGTGEVGIGEGRER